MKNFIQKFKYFILGGIFLVAGSALAVQITVPSATNSGQMLISTSTGNYIATTTDPAHFGSVYATSTTATNYFAGSVGIGTTKPTDVNANAKLTVSSISSTDIIASTTDNTTLSDAIIRSYAPGSSIFMGAHGTNQVTTQYGITVGGWGEIGCVNSTFGTSNGCLIGTRTTNTPIVFGTNSLERLRIDSTGNIGIGSSSPTAKLTVASTATGDDTPAFVIDGALTSNGNADMALNANSSGTAEANIDYNRAGITQWQLGIQNGGGATGNDFELWDGSNNPVFTINHNYLDVNIGTTTCNGASELCVWGDSGTSGNIFQVVTVASTSALSISNTGFATTTLAGLNISGSATSTSNVGFNITAGCYAVGNACISGSGASGLTSYDAWTHPVQGQSATTSLVKLFGNASSTGFSANYASIGQSGTTTITATGAVGIGSTTPFAILSINPVAGVANTTPDFVIGSSTATSFSFNSRQLPELDFSTTSSAVTGSSFIIKNTTGLVGIGTTSPFAVVSIVNLLAGGQPLLVLASSTQTGSAYPNLEVDKNGHIITSGPKPALSSCGTTPTVTGNDMSMQVTVGSVAATACTITFANAMPSSAYSIILTNESMSVVNALTISGKSSTGFTVNQTGLTSDVLNILIAPTQ